jgi:Tol biopolymer transport system component
MNEMQIRERLHDVAANAPAPATVPSTLLRRARARVALTMAASAAIVVALIAGSAIGLRELALLEPRPATEGPTRIFDEVQGWIAFRRGSDIVAVDPANPERMVTIAPAEGADPIAWSADGRRLLLHRRMGPGPLGDLFILEADGSLNRLTSTGRVQSGSFSPDGSTVVHDSVGGPWGLYEVDVATGTSQLLFDDARGDAMYPAWSPDGSRIAFLLYDEGTGSYTLWIQGPDGSRRRISGVPGARAASGLVWSPDGARLALSAISFGEQEFPTAQVSPGIYVLDRDGSGLRRVSSPVNSPFIDLWPAWSPEGSHIAFVRSYESYRPANGDELLLLPADGGDVRRIEGLTVIDVGRGIRLTGMAWNHGAFE